MRIAIDASTLSTQGGPRTYVLGLLEALLRIDHDNEYVIFYNDAAHLGRFPQAREVVLPGKSPLARLWREHVALPLACRRIGADLLHCPKSAIPLLNPGCPVVVTLHDLIPVKHPETEKRAARIYWRLHIPRAARKSKVVLTDSEHAKQEIVAAYAVPAERVKVVLLGYTPTARAIADPETTATVRTRYGLTAGYILYVGTIQPRKNIITLIEALAILRREMGTPPRLVIVGRKGWLYDDLFERIKTLGLEEAITFTGFVPDADLPAIYAGAGVFVYLSLFEGFGLPPLEAMANGVPVVVSNTTSIPEVVEAAGIQVVPTDVAAVAKAIRQVLEDGALADELRNKGRLQAGKFSWDKAGREVLDAYATAVAKGT